MTLLAFPLCTVCADGLAWESSAIHIESHWCIFPRVEEIEFSPETRHLSFTVVFENAGTEDASFMMPAFYLEDDRLICVKGEMKFCNSLPVSGLFVAFEKCTLAPQECRRMRYSFDIESAKADAAGELELELSFDKPSFKHRFSLQLTEELPFYSENLAAMQKSHEQLKLALQELQAWGYGGITAFRADWNQERELIFTFSLQDGSEASYAPEVKSWIQAPKVLARAESSGNIADILEGLTAISQACQQSSTLQEHLRQRDKAAGRVDVLRSICLPESGEASRIEFVYDKGYHATSSQQLHFTWDVDEKRLSY